MNGKILLTGGCGYIGSHTIIELLKKGTGDIISIDNYVNSTESTIKRIETITGKRIKNYAFDLRNYTETQKVFEENRDIIGVIHFAALKSVPDSVANPLWYYDNNVNSLINVLKCCQQYGVHHFIFSSSCSIYGNVKQSPVNEQTEMNTAQSPYAYTKQIGEKIISDFVKTSAVKAILLRYFNPAGADQSALIGESPINKPNNIVPVITLTGLGKIPQLTVYGGDYETKDGSCIRDFVHVSDVALAHIQALDYLISGHFTGNLDVFNLGTGKGVTVLEAIKAFEKVSGSQLNYVIGDRREGDVSSIYSDSSKAERLLGWKAKFDIEEIMRSAWNWQLELEKELASSQIS